MKVHTEERGQDIWKPAPRRPMDPHRTATKKEDKEKGRRLGGKKFLLLLQRDSVQFLAPTWGTLLAIYNSIFGEPNTFFWIWRAPAHTQCIQAYTCTLKIYIKKNSKRNSKKKQGDVRA